MDDMRIMPVSDGNLFGDGMVENVTGITPNDRTGLIQGTFTGTTNKVSKLGRTLKLIGAIIACLGVTGTIGGLLVPVFIDGGSDGLITGGIIASICFVEALIGLSIGMVGCCIKK